MKSTGTQYWSSAVNQNADATNESGFSGLPGGSRYLDGSFGGIGYNGLWWSSTDSELSMETSTPDAWYRYLDYNYDSVNRLDDFKVNGYSVRCIKD